MASTYLTAFVTVTLILAAVDLYYAYKALRQPEEIGRYLGFAAAAAGIICISYLISLHARSYIHASIANSVYFAGIDWMLVALTHFVYSFTGKHRIRHSGVVRQCIRAYALFDTGVMILNVFREVAVHYVSNSDGLAPYVYEMKPLYILHLIFTYFLVVLVLGILLDKSIKAPRQYQNQYLLNILAILFVVLINAVFLYPDQGTLLTQLDCSILGYSLGVYLMYWAAFDYRKNDMLKSLSMTIFQNIDQGIVLFDYLDELIMNNRRAEDLLPTVAFAEKMVTTDFMDRCGLPQKPFADSDHFSMQCDVRGALERPLRCDFSRLRDDTGRITGNLFVFTDAVNSTDLLTGFQYLEGFHRFVAENPSNFDHPTAAVVFDIIGLGEVNRTFGRQVGDQRIRNLAKIMHRCMPEDTYFVRGYEAVLIAVCRRRSEEDLLECVERVVSDTGGTVMYGMSATADGTKAPAQPGERPESRNILRAIETASRALQVKKLLSTSSVHSQTLTSLVRALQESDSDTEAHVQRTQRMGVELGRRIGLNDAQLADLRLLCLLHDIGKIGIPLEILNKPGRLTDQEWAVLRTHTEKGYQIAMSSDELKSIAQMILYHHERWDGMGYPEGLSGRSIPILSRVISVVDAYDAMVNDRSYRKAMSPEKAQEEVRRCSGSQFDPHIAGEFLKMLEEHPEFAQGESVGGGEVRVFLQKAVELAEPNGNTYPVLYSRYLLDLDENIIEIDDRFEAITGYHRSEVVGRMTQFDLIPVQDRPFYMVQVNNQFSRGDIAYLRHELQRKDGQIIWVVCQGKRYYDSAEKAFRSEILIFQCDEAIPAITAAE